MRCSRICKLLFVLKPLRYCNTAYHKKLYSLNRYFSLIKIGIISLYSATIFLASKVGYFLFVFLESQFSGITFHKFGLKYHLKLYSHMSCANLKGFLHRMNFKYLIVEYFSYTHRSILLLSKVHVSGSVVHFISYTCTYCMKLHVSTSIQFIDFTLCV